MGLLTRNRRAALAPMGKVRDEFESAIQRLWDGDAGLAEMTTSADWLPSVDVSESDKEIEVKIDLPGLSPEDVEISLSDHELTIKGERREESEQKEKEFHRVERRHGSFLRRIPLPASADTEHLEANADNGVITVTVPKLPEAKSKRIKVKAK